MADKRLGEAFPLWVWLTIALLVAGALAYVGAVFLMEYFVAATTGR